jgi:hypothetical protein
MSETTMVLMNVNIVVLPPGRRRYGRFSQTANNTSVRREMRAVMRYVEAVNSLPGPVIEYDEVR